MYLVRAKLQLQTTMIPRGSKEQQAGGAGGID